MFIKRSIVFIVGFVFCLTGNHLRAQVVPSGAIKGSNTSSGNSFPLVQAAKAAPIFIDEKESEVVKIAAGALSRDIELVTRFKPEIRKGGQKQLSNLPVIIGTIGQSALINQLAESKKLNIDKIKGQWESYIIAVVEKPFDNVDRALVIAGSDRRGTAYGVFELSQQIGVSPWYWWADVMPKQQENLHISASVLVQGSPSVKYRGIFLNDEDWGLQPWAAMNMDKDIKDIGPKAYAKIFELLLRLKANLIWPAMHPSTKAFFHYPGNAKVADDYAIMVGTSHAEPMLRNNVDEWNRKTMGSFDYFNNPKSVQEYWEKRVKETKDMDAIYTMGMRGEHDSGMQGAKNNAGAAVILEKIIAFQRGLLKKHVNKDAAAVPQVFTAYKEVLDIYDEGMKLPEDITLVWPDDNYGYIHRLSNPEEQKRAGGSGVYYHASYWGRPHDYLWLSSMHPALIREEMMKAYHLKTDQLWVLNVGDIKPLEHSIDLFLDMAYNAEAFEESSSVKKHLEQWTTEVFGAEKADSISAVLWEYYNLAFERKPEFMGWSRTEPTTKTDYTAYNHFYYGDEAQKRLDQYAALEKQVKAMRSQIDPKNADAFYQLVYYPVVGASLMNKKFLYRDKSFLYAKQNRISAQEYAQLSKQAYDAIVEETNYYNNQLANGKWDGMMTMKPRDLPVYQEPVLPKITINSSFKWNVMPEGRVTADSSLLSGSGLKLPVFQPWGTQSYFVDVFLTDNQPVAWEAETSDKWIKVSEEEGKLTSTSGQQQKRIWVSIDWSKVPANAVADGCITFEGEGKKYQVAVRAANSNEASDIAFFRGFVENNGYISIHAENFTRKTEKQEKHWELVEGLGHTGKSLMALPLMPEAVPTRPEQVKAQAPAVEYDFYTTTTATPTVNIFTLPTHPVTSDYGMRYGVSVDDGPVQIINFETKGRSEKWKVGVLENRAKSQVKLPSLQKGKHTLKVYMIDPGVVLDYITIDLGGLKSAYSVIPETVK